MIQMTTTQIGISQRHVACMSVICAYGHGGICYRGEQTMIAGAANVRAYTLPPLECYSSE